MMNWPGALILIFCEALACFACWCDPKATAPGGPTLLLIVTTGLNLFMLIGFYRQDLNASRLPRSAITTRPRGGDSDQEGMGEVPERDSVSASAERGSNSVQGGSAATEQAQIEVRIRPAVDREPLRDSPIHFAWWP